MSFLMTSFWWWAVGAIVVSIPVLIHLLHRQRTFPVRWGAMLFLREALLAQKRRKRVDHWLLLILRTAALALLVFLLSQPLLSCTAYQAIAPDAAVDIGVVIDHSLSTGRTAGDQSVFQRSVAALSALQDPGALKDADTVSVVLAERTPRRITPLPVPPSELGGVIAKLREDKAGLASASIADAVRVAREAAGSGRNRKKVVLVLSDGQRTSWRPQDLAAWNAALPDRSAPGGGTEVYDVPIVPAARQANLTVGNVSVSPTLVGQDRPVQVHVTVSNSGASATPPGTLRLLASGRDAGRMALPAIEPGQSINRQFDYVFGESESQWFEVRAEVADALDADNAAVTGLFVWQTLPVLVVDGQLANPPLDSTGSEKALSAFRRSRYLATAMLADANSVDSSTLIRPTLVGVTDKAINGLTLSDYAAIVLNDVPQLPPGLQGRLLDYARGGHGVWIILGRNTELTFVKDQLPAAELLRLDVADLQEAADKPMAIDVREPKHPTLAPFAGDGSGALSGLTVQKWWSVRPRDTNARTLLATQSGQPLVVERPIGANGGKIVLWTTPVDGQSGWNNWPSLRSFAPLVDVTVYELASGWTQGQENQRLQSGQPILWTGPATPSISQATIVLPDGSQQPLRPIVRDQRQIVRFSETVLPGHYELKFQPPVHPPAHFGVGIDPAELDEQSLSEADRQWFSAAEHRFVAGVLTPDGLKAALGNGSKGDDVWPKLAAALLVLLLVETLLTWRVTRSQPAGTVVV